MATPLVLCNLSGLLDMYICKPYAKKKGAPHDRNASRYYTRDYRTANSA